MYIYFKTSITKIIKMQNAKKMKNAKTFISIGCFAFHLCLHCTYLKWIEQNVVHCSVAKLDL